MRCFKDRIIVISNLTIIIMEQITREVRTKNANHRQNIQTKHRKYTCKDFKSQENDEFH